MLDAFIKFSGLIGFALILITATTALGTVAISEIEKTEDSRDMCRSFLSNDIRDSMFETVKKTIQMKFNTENVLRCERILKPKWYEF